MKIFIIKLKKLSKLSKLILLSLFFICIYFCSSVCIKFYNTKYKQWQKNKISILIQQNYKNNTNLKDRIKNFINFFYGKQYNTNSIKNELYNFKELNCITFIDHILALSVSDTFEDFEKNILNLNYYDNSKLKYKKKHFALIDYIQNNNWKKYNISFVNLTDKVFDKKDINTREITVNRYKFIKNIFSIENEWTRKLSIVKLKLKYFLPENYNKQIEQKIINHNKNGLYLLVNIPNNELQTNFTKKTESNLDINHLGFVLNENDELILYHSKIGKKTTSIKLIDYIKGELFFTKGFMIFAIK